MIEIKGKYNEAKIFTDVVDSASIAQVQELCNHCLLYTSDAADE